MADPIPSATLVIFRQAPGAATPELLFVERAKTMTFASGAVVFPGGRIDPGDRQAVPAGGDAEDDAARIAAIRETIEEVGLAIGLVPTPGPAQLRAMRSRLHGGVPLGTVIGEAGVELALDQLVPFARWCPDHPHRRIYDTRFYLARLPEGAPEAEVDATENVRLMWKSAQAMLDAADRGEVRIIFPTRRNLERLAQFDSFAAAAEHAARHPLRTVTPWRELRNGVEHLCIPDDLGYPVTSEVLASAMRG